MEPSPFISTEYPNWLPKVETLSFILNSWDHEIELNPLLENTYTDSSPYAPITIVLPSDENAIELPN